MRNILVTFSGGRTSAFMAKYIKERYCNDNLLFVFANTGKEAEATLEFANKCDKEFGLNLVWLEAEINQEKGIGTSYKIVDFETANRNGLPFKNAIRKYGLPSKVYRHCTRELKEVPIHKFAKDYFGSEYLTALGIRKDEEHRLSEKPNVIYPLAEINIDERFIREWWKKQPFDLELKDYQGNCDLCFQKSVRKRLTIIKENPETAEWWIDIENQYMEEYDVEESEGYYEWSEELEDEVFIVTNSKTVKKRRLFDTRNQLSVSDLVEMAKQPFSKAIDKQELRDANPSLFEIELDYEESCFCSRT